MRQKTSIIMHGVKESSDEKFEIRKQQDEDTLIGILHEVGCDDVSVRSVIRLGRWGKERMINPAR